MARARPWATAASARASKDSSVAIALSARVRWGRRGATSRWRRTERTCRQSARIAVPATTARENARATPDLLTSLATDVRQMSILFLCVCVCVCVDAVVVRHSDLDEYVFLVACANDCSIRTCPSGIAWFDLPISDNRAHRVAVCSGVGVCDTSKGECVCPAPFEGASCERMKCSGIEQPCNGNGRCVTMAELARQARNNGEPIAITYGKTPNNPKIWDFNKIQGCLCDEGFEGHDCSLRSCPRGDDPRTTGQRREVQTILCSHTQVTTFTLSFRGESTQPLSSDITALNLQNALGAVKSIGLVNVKYSSGTSACTLTGTNKISIEFISALGDVPLFA
ncbi:hypothetical protein FI667_g3587, partial [Globisporangium splendens]